MIFQYFVCILSKKHFFAKFLEILGGFYLNPIVVGLFDSTILVGGGKKAPPLPNSLLVIGRATKFGVLKASGMYFL